MVDLQAELALQLKTHYLRRNTKENTKKHWQEWFFFKIEQAF